MSAVIPTMPGRLFVVLNRFLPNVEPRFRAATMPDAPIRTSAADAEADELAWREQNGGH